jgi:hypothetical protein
MSFMHVPLHVDERDFEAYQVNAKAYTTPAPAPVPRQLLHPPVAPVSAVCRRNTPNLAAERWIRCGRKFAVHT